MNRKSTNIFWHKMQINREKREELLDQKGILIWFTGLSGSGKSTVASALESKLYDMGKLTYLLDGDNVRYGLNSNLGFTKEDRSENIRRISEVCKLFVDAGLITIATFVSPFKEDRDRARKLLGDDFIEIYVDCPLEVCKKRDPKGIYKKAISGKIKNFTGIDSEYEVPHDAEITISTHISSLEDCVNKILNYMNL